MFWFILATLSAALSAAAAILQKKTLFKLTALEFSFLVSVVILIFSSFIPFTININSLQSSTLFIVIFKSILGGTAFLLVMMSLEHNQISTALPILGLTPGVTAIAALLMIGESLHSAEWIGIILMMAGTYVLESKPNQNIFQPFKDILITKNHYYMYAALGLFAVSSVFDKILMSGHNADPLIVLFYQHIVYCVMFALLLIIRKESVKKVFQKGISFVPLVAVIALLTILYRFTQLEATKLAPVALVLAIKRTSILYASFFGGKLFSDERLTRKLIAGALIVGAGFIILRNAG